MEEILKILEKNCTVYPSQPSGVVYVFTEKEMTEAAREIMRKIS